MLDLQHCATGRLLANRKSPVGSPEPAENSSSTNARLVVDRPLERFERDAQMDSSRPPGNGVIDHSFRTAIANASAIKAVQRCAKSRTERLQRSPRLGFAVSE